MVGRSVALRGTTQQERSMMRKVQSDLAVFVGEIARFLLVHRNRNSAVLWPRHEPRALLTALRAEAAGAMPGPASRSLASLLAARLGGAVTAGYPVTAEGIPAPAGELLFVPLRGSHLVDFQPSGRAPVTLRLHTAELLYLPPHCRPVSIGRGDPVPLLVLRSSGDESGTGSPPGES
jgi:hypothetical protein